MLAANTRMSIFFQHQYFLDVSPLILHVWVEICSFVSLRNSLLSFRYKFSGVII